MPRLARKNINTPFVHVMVQGVNKGFIFDNPKNINCYLKNIKKESKYEEFNLLSYCIMSNHAHFLFYVKDMICFGKFMKEVNQNFAIYYNKTNNRVGVVFRNRFLIEPIDKRKHLLNCIKYIHNNPVKAKMVEKCEEYPYSSYQDFLYGKGCAKSEILKEIIGENVDYLKEIEESSDVRFLDFEVQPASREFFETGINCFKKEYNISLVEVFSNREIMQKMIIYLKMSFKLRYNETLQWLGIPKAIMRNI